MVISEVAEAAVLVTDMAPMFDNTGVCINTMC